MNCYPCARGFFHFCAPQKNPGGWKGQSFESLLSSTECGKQERAHHKSRQVWGGVAEICLLPLHVLSCLQSLIKWSWERNAWAGEGGSERKSYEDMKAGWGVGKSLRNRTQNSKNLLAAWWQWQDWFQPGKRLGYSILWQYCSSCCYKLYV